MADRQPLFREAIARTIRQRAAFQLAGEVADGRSALEAIVLGRPHVAIVDLHLPLLDGDRVINAAVRDELATSVILLAPVTDARRAYEAVAAGAAGWASRTTDEADLCAAIAAAARGDAAFTRDAQTAIAAEIRRRSQLTGPLLDDLERQILTLVARGLNVRAIGRELGLPPSVVRSAQARLYRRLGVSDRAAAVATSLRRRLIE